MGKTGIIAKFHWTDLVICSHSREGKSLSYSEINTVSFKTYVKTVNTQLPESYVTVLYTLLYIIIS